MGGVEGGSGRRGKAEGKTGGRGGGVGAGRTAEERGIGPARPPPPRRCIRIGIERDRFDYQSKAENRRFRPWRHHPAVGSGRAGPGRRIPPPRPVFSLIIIPNYITYH